MCDVVILFCVGILTGFVNVIAGAGSMISISSLIFLGLPGAVANATNRVGLVAQNVTAILTFYRKGFSDLKLSLSLAAFTVPGSIIGALIAAKIRTEDFKLMLAIIMGVIILLMLTEKKGYAGTAAAPKSYSRARWWLAHCFMVFIGLWGGFIGIGAAFVLLPMLNRVLGLDLVTANMHKVTVSLVYTLVALATFATQLNINWIFGVYLSGGMILGAFIGTHLQVKHGHEFVKWILVAVVAIFVASLF